MYKQIPLFFILLFVISSCDFLVKKTEKNSVDNPIITPIDFTSIDGYPLLPACKDVQSRKAQKMCFYKTLSMRLEVSLSGSTLQWTKPIQDTIFIKLQVSNKGIIKLNSISLPSKNALYENNLKEFISEKLIKFPRMEPAIKAGIPVTTEFTVPLLMK